MNLKIASLVLLSVFVATSPVFAQQPVVDETAYKPTVQDMKRSEQLKVQAKELFYKNEFEAASVAFFEAYKLSRRPALLFNAARAKEQARMFADAKKLFETYKLLPDATAQGSKEADEHLALIEQQLAPLPQLMPPLPTILKTQETVPKPKIVPLKPEHASSGVVVEPSVAPTTTVEYNPALAGTDGFRANRLLTWQSGTAVAALAVGGAMMIIGMYGSRTANQIAITNQDDILKYKSKYGSAQVEWYTGLGLGAVGLGMGIWAGWEAAHPAQQKWPTHVVPTVDGQGGFGAAVTGNF
ncbi:MAG: hypothetical protein NT003_04695 [Candidatus Magasanikbacteria bacterium]|nr:hypothetical protein [Candidatus Magasanikbacteria bacterium]